MAHARPPQVVFTIISYIVGVLVFTILVGIMSSIVLSLNRSGQMYVEKLQVSTRGGGRQAGGGGQVEGASSSGGN